MSNEKEALTAQEILEQTEESSQKKDPSSPIDYLTFVSDGLTYGVPTEQVIEIITNHTIRPIPLVPHYVQGIINLRGQIIPIIDIRLPMGKPFEEYTSTTCIIILDIGSDRIGICVDAVSQVLDIDPTQSRPVPLERRQDLAPSMVSAEDGKVILLLKCTALTEH